MINKSRDHREIGRQMGVFAIQPAVGSGLPLWLPAGAVIRRELEQYAHQIAVDTGCEGVYSPVLAKRELFERSGHWAKFADDMFPPLDLGGEERDHLVLRPANCPHHAMMYSSTQRSYRELPIRYNELAPMFRAERSGVVSGLSRVRQITLDDTHVFCRPDQISAEVELALGGLIEAYRVLGIKIKYLRLSRRDAGDGYLGEPEQWRHAEDQLRNALEVADLGGLPVREAEGEAAFYGPKIDVQVDDPRGHEETLATVQLDFNQPDGLDLNYIAEDGSRQRVMMIHRGLIGAMERVVAFLLEEYDGRLPIWLAPVQLCLLPVSVEQQQPAHRLADRCRRAGLRVRVVADGTLGGRIRESRLRRDAVIGVLGEAEIDQDLVAVQDPATGMRAQVAGADLLDALSAAVGERAVRIRLPGSEPGVRRAATRRQSTAADG